MYMHDGSIAQINVTEMVQSIAIELVLAWHALVALVRENGLSGEYSVQYD